LPAATRAAACRIARLALPYSQEEIEQAILETVRRNGHDACYIRPLVFRGYDTLVVDGRSCPVHTIIATIPWGRYLGQEAIEQGVDVCISSWRRLAPGTAAAMAKIGGQYVNSQLVVMEARDNGFTEGIVLDAQGYVSEGSGENVFVVSDGIIYTPPLAASILAGVTRRCVMALAADLGFEVREQFISRDMLYMADEVFFTGTAAEITPIRSIDRIPIGNGGRGPITKALQERFFGITGGGIEDRHGWLTYVHEEASNGH